MFIGVGDLVPSEVAWRFLVSLAGELVFAGIGSIVMPMSVKEGGECCRFPGTCPCACRELLSNSPRSPGP